MKSLIKTLTLALIIASATILPVKAQSARVTAAVAAMTTKEKAYYEEVCAQYTKNVDFLNNRLNPAIEKAAKSGDHETALRLQATRGKQLEQMQSLLDILGELTN